MHPAHRQKTSSRQLFTDDGSAWMDGTTPVLRTNNCANNDAQTLKTEDEFARLLAFLFVDTG